MCGPKFCSMKISQEVRDVAKANQEAAQQDSALQEKALQEKGMQDMATAFNNSGAALYHGADTKVQLP